MARLDARLEVRVDSMMMRRLTERAALDRRSVAQVIREALEGYLAESTPEMRRAILEATFNLNVPVPEDPQELRQQILDSMAEDVDEELRMGIEDATRRDGPCS